MALSWKYLVPAAFACFVFTLLWQMAVTAAPRLELATGFALTALAVVLVLLFVRQVMRNISLVHGDKVDLSNW
jgi:NADH-quinone oxidoreductase subunit H